MNDDAADVISEVIGSRELHARERRRILARDRFVAWLAWRCRDLDESAREYTDLLPDER